MAMAIHIHSPEGTVDRVSRDELITIGRAPGNMIQLAEPQVSGIHGQILRRDGRYWYQDLGSTNGSMVLQSGEEIVVDGIQRREVELQSPAILLLGDRSGPVRLHVEEVDDDQARAPKEGVVRTIVASRAVREIGGVSRSILASPLVDRSRLERLYELLGRLQERLEPPAIAAELVSFLFETLPRVSVAGIYYQGKRDIVPILLRSRSSEEPLAIPWNRLSPLFETAIRGREALQVEEPREVSMRLEAAAPDLKAAMACPLFDADDLTGLVVVAGPNRFPEAELDWLIVLAHQAGQVLRNAQLVTKLQGLSARLSEENAYLKSLPQADTGGEVTIVGESSSLKRVLKQVEVVARTDTTVLVLGETGTGKELVARQIHNSSPRHERLFAAVNCGALSETLLESELFGHVKGAFTGASRDKLGLLQVADQGTLFLDEFGDVSPRLQVKLLRVLENGEVTPVGSVKTLRVDVRIVAATNKELEKEVAEKRFREDLYYRINVFPVRLPPLRERSGDIPLLARHFLEIYAKRFDKTIAGLSEAALVRLEQYKWPGNVRELQNEMERAVLMAETETIEPEDLSERVGGVVELPVEIGPLHDTMARLEEQYIRRALRQHDYNRTHTARTLGISRQALTAKLHKYDLISLK